MGKLTVLGVKNAKPGRHADGLGLYLRVKKNKDGSAGARSWLLRVQSKGNPHLGEFPRKDIGLGSVSDLTLAEAREKAAALRKIARAGGDPVAERDKGRNREAVPTFKAAALAYHEASKPGWAPRHAGAWLSSMQRHVFPKLGGSLVSAVDAPAIERALQSIWLGKPVMARKLRHRIATTLNYAKGKGWRSEPAPSDAVRELLKVRSQPRGGNFSAMPFVQVPALVASLQAEAETMGRLALLFTIFTVARSGEVRKGRVKHIAADDRLWNRPPEMMKMGTAHSVTLNDGALAVLAKAAELRGHSRPDSLLFPGKGGQPLADTTLTKVLRDAGITETVHGFRSAFRDWAAEEMPATPEAVAEAALAHAVPDAVIAAYRRTTFLELRRKLLDAWGGYLTGRSNVLHIATG